MSQPPLVLEFAEHSRELSRVSQVPFLCASFWQGLCFAVQIQRRSSSQPFTAPLTLLLLVLQPSTELARPVDYHRHRLDVSETQRLRPRPAPDVTGGYDYLAHNLKLIILTRHTRVSRDSYHGAWYPCLLVLHGARAN